MLDTRTLGPRMSLGELVMIFDGLFDREAYRLETLDYYDSSLYSRWLAGEAYDRSGWDQILAGYAADGKTVCRVHLLPDALTSYLVHEIEFYRGSVQKGEDIRVIRKDDAPGDIPEGFDYWLFDRRLAALMEYDEKGVCTAVTLTADSATVHKCVRWRDEAVAGAMTLVEYDRKVQAC